MRYNISDDDRTLLLAAKTYIDRALYEMSLLSDHHDLLSTITRLKTAAFEIGALVELVEEEGDE